MKGMLVKHTHRGIGKIEEVQGRYLKIIFLESGEKATFETEAFEEKELKHFKLPIRSVCNSNGKTCIVDEILFRDQKTCLQFYLVTFSDDGLQIKISEDKLLPTGEVFAQNFFEKFQNKDFGSYSLFAPRENLVASIQRMLKNGNGLKALLSSRIDLRPHQAYVAGVVLLDESRRYLLADEVGLGKTIEAGIIINDLLINKPDARILILCPSSLTQQWLCEIYAKFSRHVFRMLEMMKPDLLDLPKTQRLIASFIDAGLNYPDQLLAEKWDLVVVDEVHHLLTSKSLYEFVHRLSFSAPSILLLSAIPAKHREGEFLKLLTLLEPDRYKNDFDYKSFELLFENQRSIGRKLRLLRKRIEGLNSGEFTRDEILEYFNELNTIDIISINPWVSDSIKQLLNLNNEELIKNSNLILRKIAENFRINRRILRNRRQRLIEDEQINETKREVIGIQYESEQLEHEVNISVNELLKNMKYNKLDLEILEIFSAIVLQSVCHPSSILEILQTLETVKSENIDQINKEYLKFGYLNSNTSWSNYLGSLCKSAKSNFDSIVLSNAIKACEKWGNDPTSNTRLYLLIKQLKLMQSKNLKIIIFCGYPGIALKISAVIKKEFGDKNIAEFLTDFSREEKEANVQRFQTDIKTWILVSDESGGEGRNFQFADLLIHYDNPWDASKIEQRIGRLDRLGRTLNHVKSYVIYDNSSVESGLFVCLRDGIEVFSRSISGLEFALRGVESSMLSVAIDEGKEGVERFAKELKEIVDAERERDESDAVLDEASFDRQTAESFLRVRSNEESEKDLEKSFLNFFEMVACRPKSVEDSIFPNGIWSFNGDLIHQIRNDYTNKLSNKIFKGTFRRAIAQQRIDLDYFTLGQPLFEAIYHSLHVEAVGRTYAIKIKRSDIDKNWSGFEYIFNPKPKTSNIGDNIGLQNRARQFFNFRTIHVFCDFNGLIANNSEELLTIRQSIKQQHKDKTWQNLTDKDKKNLDEPSQLNKDFFDWRTIVEHNFKIAKNHAYQSCKQVVDKVINEAWLVLESQIKNIRIIDSASSYIQPLLDLQNSISNWDLELDSIGYLSLNKSSN